MTALQVFNAVLIELNKVKAPSLLLEDFNYFFNKEITQYINKIYNLYETNQQKTDDLGVLHASVILTPTIQNDYASSFKLLDNTYEVFLPDDYVHILNCVVEYETLKQNGCNKVGDYVYIGAKKLKSDNWPQILNNYYFKPTYKNPYYFLTNVETTINYPTTDNRVGIENLQVNKNGNVSYGNSSKVRMEIRYGKDSPNFKLRKVYVDYIKSHKHIDLTQDQIDDIEDSSQIIEFPDYDINEIIN